MPELRSHPYSRSTRPDTVDTERQFRDRLPLSDVNGVLFNVLATRHSATLAEYDAVFWKGDGICFMEYKDSVAAHRRMTAKRVQQVSDISRNLAKAFGFAEYNYTVVVNGLPESVVKGGNPVISLEELPDFDPVYGSVYIEIDYIEKLIRKYGREENPVQPDNATMVSELRKVRDMLLQG